MIKNKKEAQKESKWKPNKKVVMTSTDNADRN